MRVPTFLSVCLLLTAACAHRPEPLAMDDFMDQILAPLSMQRADELLQQRRAVILAEAALRPVVQRATSASRFESKTAGDPDIQMEQQLAALESRRMPLQRALLQSYRERTRLSRGLYRVCIEGAERRYEPSGDRFLRLDNGEGPCPTHIVDLSSLR
jgi:hypothetical protein